MGIKQLSIRSKLYNNQLIVNMASFNHSGSSNFRVQRMQNVYEDIQEQMNYFLNFHDDESEDVVLKNNFPPLGRYTVAQDSSVEQGSSNESLKTVSDLFTEAAKTQSHRQESFNDELLQVIDEKKPKKETKKRNDGNDFAQNNSSSARSMVCKMISRQRPKDWKKLIKDVYDKFLKENKVTNSQVVLIFTYLFLMKSKASEWIYSEFKQEFLEHLSQARSKAETNPDKKLRSALLVKIDANMELLAYVFDLKGQQEINFQYVKTICEPLFTGRQSKTLQKPLKKAKEIQRELWTARNTIPCSYTLLSDRKTSNISTGCQVEL